MQCNGQDVIETYQYVIGFVIQHQIIVLALLIYNIM